MNVARELDAAKAAFIVRGGARAEEQIRYLACLQVPGGMTADVVTVEGMEAELPALYRQVQAESDAKYKVYLAPDAVILKEDFLAEVLRIFHAMPEAGILGVLGARQLLTDGIAEHAPELVGRMLYRTGSPVEGQAAAGAAEAVSALAGGMVVTQQDVPWRTDLFSGASFLASSASVEYRRAGWQAVVPQQAEAWLLRDAPAVWDEADRAAFLDEYSRDLYPLVSVVIPTYQRPQYFREALRSAVRQTYRNLDIFVTDNSHNEETKRVYEQEFASDPRIHYEHHPDFDAGGNWSRAIAYDNPEAAYVNWLMDDDRFFPEKIARMMDDFFRFPDITLVTTPRHLIDENGNERPPEPWSGAIVDKPTRIAGSLMGQAMLCEMTNFVGEPTTALVKKSAMHEHRLGWTGREGKYLVSDFPTWLCVLSKGDLIYLPEPLSDFRIHGTQQQNSVFTHVACLICWALELQEALRRGLYLRTEKEKREAVTMWLYRTSETLRRYKDEDWTQPHFVALFEAQRSMTAALTNGWHLAFDIDTGA